MKIPEEMSEAEFLLGIIKSANDVSPINFIMLLYAKFDIIYTINQYLGTRNMIYLNSYRIKIQIAN